MYYVDPEKLGRKWTSTKAIKSFVSVCFSLSSVFLQIDRECVWNFENLRLKTLGETGTSYSQYVADIAQLP